LPVDLTELRTTYDMITHNVLVLMVYHRGLPEHCSKRRILARDYVLPNRRTLADWTIPLQYGLLASAFIIVFRRFSSFCLLLHLHLHLLVFQP
jgi:hypothetical protein